MTDDVLEKYIKQHISATTEDIINFSWHGGEPLLAGIDFYKKVLHLQSKYKPSGKTILNGIQTNGTLLDEKWCAFFAENNFIIGISIDGPEELHDLNRITKDGNPTWQSLCRIFSFFQNTVLSRKSCVL